MNDDPAFLFLRHEPWFTRGTLTRVRIFHFSLSMYDTTASLRLFESTTLSWYACEASDGAAGVPANAPFDDRQDEPPSLNMYAS